jgi:hypothetical protein
MFFQNINKSKNVYFIFKYTYFKSIFSDSSFLIGFDIYLLKKQI